MLRLNTERIWELSPGDTITPRSGEVSLDHDEVIINDSDIRGILTVGKGLKNRDVAIFLSFDSDETSEEPEPEGYFVGRVEPDGSGVLVHSWLVELSPRDYANGHIVEMWQYLEQVEPAIFEEFTVHALGAYIQSLPKK